MGESVRLSFVVYSYRILHRSQATQLWTWYHSMTGAFSTSLADHARDTARPRKCRESALHEVVRARKGTEM